MSMEGELQKAKMVLICGVLFLVSIFFSYSEMKYIAYGETAQATMLRAYESSSRGRRGRERQSLVVEYQFVDKDGSVRRESDRVARTWDLDRSAREVQIEYIPGEAHSSRLHGHSQMIWVYIFLASLAGMVFFVFKFWRFYKS